MTISEERLNQLAHRIVDSIWDDDLVDYTDEDAAFRIARRVLGNLMNEESELDEKVRVKIRSLKRNVVEGGTEWDLLYKKYYEEELNRRG